MEAKDTDNFEKNSEIQNTINSTHRKNLVYEFDHKLMDASPPLVLVCVVDQFET